MKTNFKKMAEKFAKKYGLKMKILGVEYKKHFFDDTMPRYVFKIKLSRNGKSYTLNFGQSIMEGSQEPTMYEVLACMQKYEPGTFEEFCSNYGYNMADKKAKLVYKAVVKEYNAVERLFNDVWNKEKFMEEFRAIY